jgi:hypothetical protein
MAYEIKSSGSIKDTLFTAAALLLLAVVAVLAYMLSEYLDVPRRIAPTIEFWKPYVGTFYLQLAFTVLVILIGFGLFVLRNRRRDIYAVLEIFVGIFAAVYASNELVDATTPNSLTKAVVATVGGLYIIVRGLDNLQQAQQPKA